MPVGVAVDLASGVTVAVRVTVWPAVEVLDDTARVVVDAGLGDRLDRGAAGRGEGGVAAVGRDDRVVAPGQRRDREARLVDAANDLEAGRGLRRAVDREGDRHRWACPCPSWAPRSAVNVTAWPKLDSLGSR